MDLGGWLLVATGGVLIGAPIVIHLLMQRKPKHQIFPGFRFLLEKKETNKRQVLLRHILLLILRCLVILVLALALANPRAPSNAFGNYLLLGGISISGLLVAILLLAVIMIKGWTQRVLIGVLGVLLLGHLIGGSVVLAQTLAKPGKIMLGKPEAPVAAVLMFDTSARMDFQSQNTSRLDEARRIGSWVIEELPSDSRIAIGDMGRRTAFFSVDAAAAEKRMKTLTPQHMPVKIDEAIRDSIQLLNSANEEQKEIYLFTDLNRMTWTTERADSLRRLLEDNSNVALYVIDVGVEKPTNISLGELKLSSETITQQGTLIVGGEVLSVGDSGKRTLEFRLEKPDQTRPIRQDGETLVPEEHWVRTNTIDVQPDQSTGFQFELSGIAPGVHQGYVDVIGEDGLAFDNRRYFTIEVREQWPGLVIRPPDVNETNAVQSLAPYAYQQAGLAKFDFQVIDQDNISRVRLDDYALILLLDPKPLSETVWNLLADYVSDGGGLFIMLGHNAANGLGADESFVSEAAMKVMPGLLSEIWRASGEGELFISPQDLSHPILAPFRKIRSQTPWAEFPIHLHWGLRSDDSVDPTDIRIVTRYSNRMPALVERSIGKGRVLTLTTPYTEPATPDGRRRWNDLLLGECWPAWLMFKESGDYLVQAKQARLNYQVGEVAVIENEPDNSPEEFRMFAPDNEEPRRVEAGEPLLQYRFTERPGAYRLKGEFQNKVELKGFSVNASATESLLERVDEEQLSALLGEDRYLLARTEDEIEREQGVIREGMEFYPYLILLLVICLALESLFSNRFYGSRVDAARSATKSSRDTRQQTVGA